METITIGTEVALIMKFCFDGSMDDFVTIVNPNPYHEGLRAYQLRVDDAIAIGDAVKEALAEANSKR